jgi:hypothetical protein
MTSAGESISRHSFSRPQNSSKDLAAGRQQAGRLAAQDLVERVAAADVLPDPPGNGAAHAGQHLQQAQPRQLVARVLQDAEVAEDVLHVRLLEEAQAAPDMERDIATLELQLNLQRVPVAAVEHGYIVQRAALVKQVQHIFGDEPGLGEVVLAGHDRGLEARSPDRLEVLRQPAAVLGDTGVGQRQDLRHGAVVGFELVLLARGTLLERDDVLEVRPAEAVDRLRIVADHRQVAVLRASRSTIAPWMALVS